MGYRELPLEKDMPAAFHEWLRWLPLQEDKPPTTVRAYSQGLRRLVSFAEIFPTDFRPDSFGQAEITDAVRTMGLAQQFPCHGGFGGNEYRAHYIF